MVAMSNTRISHPDRMEKDRDAHSPEADKKGSQERDKEGDVTLEGIQELREQFMRQVKCNRAL